MGENNRIGNNKSISKNKFIILLLIVTILTGQVYVPSVTYAEENEKIESMADDVNKEDSEELETYKDKSIDIIRDMYEEIKKYSDVSNYILEKIEINLNSSVERVRNANSIYEIDAIVEESENNIIELRETLNQNIVNENLERKTDDENIYDVSANRDIIA
ncbi:V-type ATPase 116kDa subunit family protein, partial [Anaerosphaera multitolerans]